MIRAFAVLLALFAGGVGTASAATLNVGPGQPYDTPSKAVAAAHDGDTIRIAPGQYYDCAIVRRSNVTIEGAGPGAVMTDTVCQGKAILVIDGNDVTVKNLTLQRARVSDGNGAGIRAEGGNLTIDGVRFINNQDGILSANNLKATIRILDSTFQDNGVCNRSCAHAVYIGDVAELDVEKSHFSDTHVGHNIKSRALETRVIGCDIEDGPTGTSSYLIDIPNGGGVLIEGNRMEKGPKTSNHSIAIDIGEEGVHQPTPSIVVKDNVFTNNSGHSTIFVNNLTATPVQLSGNVFKGDPVRPFQGDGSRG